MNVREMPDRERAYACICHIESDKMSEIVRQNKMSDRMPGKMRDQNVKHICKIECQNNCQIKCQIESQKKMSECRIESQIES